MEATKLNERGRKLYLALQRLLDLCVQEDEQNCLLVKKEAMQRAREALREARE